MTRPAVIGQAMMGFLFVTGSAVAGQSSDRPLLGLIGNEGSGHPFFVWNGSEWSERRDDPPIQAPLVLVDSLGRIQTGSLGDPREGLTWIYDLNGVEGFLPADPPLQFQYLGYLISPGLDHAPFLPADSPLSAQDWDSFLSSVLPSRDADIPNRFDIRVWTARANAGSFTYFTVERQADRSPGCLPLYLFTGWFPPGSADPIIATSTEANCDGKGSVSRRPMGLVIQAGHPTLVIGFYDWDGFGMEVWQLIDGELRLQGHSSAI